MDFNRFGSIPLLYNNNEKKKLIILYLIKFFEIVCCSGSSSGSGGSIPHSFSVDEIQKMRIKLRSSKSYPNELLLQESEQLDERSKTSDDTNATEKNQPTSKSMHTNGKLMVNHDECDNSSSGVSSDQEIISTTKSIMKPTTNSVTIASKESAAMKLANSNNFTNQNNNNNNNINNNNNKSNNNGKVHSGKIQQHGILKTSAAISNALAATNPLPNVKIIEAINKKSINLPPLSSVTKKISDAIADDTTNANDDFDDLPSPPAKAFQRHNSLTRKQAATIAMNRALYTKSAVSLVQLPPPIEVDADETDHGGFHRTTDKCRYDGQSFNHDTIKRSNGRVTVAATTTTTTTVAAATATAIAACERTRLQHSDKNSNDDGEDIVLAPPPEFSDSVSPLSAGATSSSNVASGRGNVSVRIVGAVPKTSRLQSH